MTYPEINARVAAIAADITATPRIENRQALQKAQEFRKELAAMREKIDTRPRTTKAMHSRAGLCRIDDLIRRRIDLFHSREKHAARHVAPTPEQAAGAFRWRGNKGRVSP